jgi:hypothetical protein
MGTLGSCFAQHLARNIQASGYDYFVAEQAPIDATPPQRATYGVFSARYGNVYTVRQALQLFERAFDGRSFEDDTWSLGSRWVDAFRPRAEPHGFGSREVVRSDRDKHLTAVREVFTETRVLVFTLGLTEAWVSNSDGAVYPLAPGVAGGSYEPANYAFANFQYPEVRSDLQEWIQRVKAVNPHVKILLTVSPVPLAATYEDRHVWASTAYSKATLLAAARDVAAEHDMVDYFPSYEVITSPSTEGRYMEDDLRSVREIGVAHVMRLFRAHYLSDESGASNRVARSQTFSQDRIDNQRAVSAVLCEEELLDPDQTARVN